MNEENIKDLQRKGTAALQDGEIERAVELLQKALSLDPTDIDSRLNLSSALILQKRFKDAAPLLKSLTVDEPENPIFWLNLGAALLGNPILATNDQQEEAIGAFKAALDINPRLPNAAYNIGLVYRDQQNYELAREWFEKAVATFPDDDDARYYIELMNEKINAETKEE